MWELTKLYVIADLLRTIIPVLFAGAALRSLIEEVKNK